MIAGHCGNVGTSWSTGAGFYGTTVFSALNNGGTNRVDTAAIAPSGGVGSYFYVGSPSSNGGVRVGFYFPGNQVGVTGLRTSGSTSGEQYSGTGSVLSTDLTVNFGSAGTFHHLNYAECFSSPGDSGGPVFAVGTGGSIIAAGTISGVFTSDAPGRCLYTPVDKIIAQYGGTPLG